MFTMIYISDIHAFHVYVSWITKMARCRLLSHAFLYCCQTEDPGFVRQIVCVEREGTAADVFVKHHSFGFGFCCTNSQNYIYPCSELNLGEQSGFSTIRRRHSLLLMIDKPLQACHPHPAPKLKN